MKIKEWEKKFREMSNEEKLDVHLALGTLARIDVFKTDYPEFTHLRTILACIMTEQVKESLTA